MPALIAPPSLPAQWTSRRAASFPSITLPAAAGQVPVEVCLIARLGHGAGDKLFYEAWSRQRQHPHFVDAMEEPSARLGGTDFARGDATALYTFGVGPDGHPFHKHAGHRVFTAVSGSGGAQLRFSFATLAEIEEDPRNFVRHLRHVNVPPDCLFSVRFSGETWHQFAPLHPRSGHPAFFALSTHTNEAGGDLSEDVRRAVLADQGDIPLLTQLLPEATRRWLQAAAVDAEQIPTTHLSLHDRPGSLLERACRVFRSLAGHLYRVRHGFGMRAGYVSTAAPAQVRVADELADDSLLRFELTTRTVHHQDAFTLTEVRPVGSSNDVEAWLAAMLDGFLVNRPRGVSRMMAARNLLVRPLKLRTSPLGCPVSSLLGPQTHLLFDRRFPVRAHETSADGQLSQVILGADDKHLVFRSCVSVRLKGDAEIEVSLSNRVACSNAFGRLYMAVIAGTHRRYVAPAMLVSAVAYAMERQTHPGT